jgi:hypothetical protein
MMTLNKNIQFFYLQAMLLVVLTCVSIPLKAATKEQAVKAGSVYNFTKFTIWPNAVATADQFHLCVYSTKRDDGLQALKGKKVADKSLVLHRNVKDRELSTCHMIFIENDSKKNTRKLLNKVKKLPILTVSDNENFIDKGGMIGFIKNGEKVGFEINIANVNASGIYIGSQLLKLAKTVKGLN